MEDNYIECNTDNIHNAGTKICDYLDELQAEIDSFFKKIERIPYTGEWTGKNAEIYCEKVYTDLKTYSTFISNMRNIADEMKRFADDTDDKVRLCEKEVLGNGSNI